MDHSIKRTIIEQFKATVKKGIPSDIDSLINAWIDLEAQKIIESTRQITKEDVRIKTIVMLFEKKFDRVRKLIAILQYNELLENADLFEQLLSLF